MADPSDENILNTASGRLLEALKAEHWMTVVGIVVSIVILAHSHHVHRDRKTTGWKKPQLYTNVGAAGLLLTGLFLLAGEYAK